MQEEEEDDKWVEVVAEEVEEVDKQEVVNQYEVVGVVLQVVLKNVDKCSKIVIT